MENTPEQWYKNLPTLTRVGLTVIFGVTVLVQLEILNPMLLYLNWPLILSKLQVWRLFTSCVFFGGFSFQFIFQLYFFTSFSSKLERNEIFDQPGDYLWFLICEILLLDALSALLQWPTGLPALGPALVFAILYYWSRREPYANLSFFSFTIKGYQFPFALIFFQLLMGGNIWMDLVGLAAGHIYYFLKELVPSEYGYTIIKTPRFLITFMSKYAVGGPGGATPGAGGGARAGAPGGGGGAGGGAGPALFGGGGQRLGGN